MLILNGKAQKDLTLAKRYLQHATEENEKEG